MTPAIALIGGSKNGRRPEHRCVVRSGFNLQLFCQSDGSVCCGRIRKFYRPVCP